jgi:putative cell wall-binding protein
MVRVIEAEPVERLLSVVRNERNLYEEQRSEAHRELEELRRINAELKRDMTRLAQECASGHLRLEGQLNFTVLAHQRSEEARRALEAQREEMLDALTEALEYVPTYFREKWDMDALLRRHGRLARAELDRRREDESRGPA